MSHHVRDGEGGLHFHQLDGPETKTAGLALLMPRPIVRLGLWPSLGDRENEAFPPAPNVVADVTGDLGPVAGWSSGVALEAVDARHLVARPTWGLARPLYEYERHVVSRVRFRGNGRVIASSYLRPRPVGHTRFVVGALLPLCVVARDHHSSSSARPRVPRRAA